MADTSLVFPYPDQRLSFTPYPVPSLTFEVQLPQHLAHRFQGFVAWPQTQILEDEALTIWTYPQPAITENQSISFEIGEAVLDVGRGGENFLLGIDDSEGLVHEVTLVTQEGVIFHAVSHANMAAE